MSDITIRLYSNCLRRFTTFKMYLPNDVREDLPMLSANENEYSKKHTRTLFLLHGYTGDAENWIPTEFAEKYNFAIVIPTGENSFWLDGISTGHQFCKFLGEELLGYVIRTGNEQRRNLYLRYVNGRIRRDPYGIILPRSIRKGRWTVFGVNRT